jgi:hypothetical protein
MEEIIVRRVDNAGQVIVFVTALPPPPLAVWYDSWTCDNAIHGFLFPGHYHQQCCCCCGSTNKKQQTKGTETNGSSFCLQRPALITVKQTKGIHSSNGLPEFGHFPESALEIQFSVKERKRRKF